MLPTLTRVLLHIGHHVHLIYDLETEDGFYHILKGQYTLEAAVVINHHTYLRFLLQHFVKNIAYACFLVEVQEWAFDLA